MGTYFQTHTSDMSASLSCSSVANSMAQMETVVEKTIVDGPSGASKQTNREIGSSLVSVITNLFAKGKYESVIEIADELVSSYPKSFFLHNVLGEAYAFLGENQKAIVHFKTALEICSFEGNEHLRSSCMPNIYNNIGIAFKSIGLLEESESHLLKAINLNPFHAPAYNNFGNLLNEKADLPGAQEKFLKAIDIEPSGYSAYWNLHSTVNEEEKAKAIIEQCLVHSPTFKDAVFTLAGMKAFSGNDRHLNDLLSAGFADEPILRSINWVLSLPKIPEIHYNRWSIFDRAIELCDTSRPFYEYGVWMGDSFKYLMKSFQKGYGFDTFEGLPEDWGPVPKGTYSSFGKVPNIKGGEFIIGEFENSLPHFFAEKRPLAGLINFDADLYASTLCALVHSKAVIDTNTVLIFDEFIINSDWENDEFRALNEFCKANEFDYEVIAISLYTKQVMVRLLGL
jgi:tetratricopeptide (TPR) repeat protein